MAYHRLLGSTPKINAAESLESRGRNRPGGKTLAMIHVLGMLKGESNSRACVWVYVCPTRAGTYVALHAFVHACVNMHQHICICVSACLSVYGHVVHCICIYISVHVCCHVCVWWWWYSLKKRQSSWPLHHSQWQQWFGCWRIAGQTRNCMLPGMGEPGKSQGRPTSQPQAVAPLPRSSILRGWPLGRWCREVQFTVCLWRFY